jgi:hypothetical protein
MVNNNDNENANTTNADANLNTTIPIPPMSEEAKKKLQERIAEREAAAKSGSSSNYIALTVGQRFKGIFTGNVKQDLVKFKGNSKLVPRYNYEVLLLEDEQGKKIQANSTTIFSASKTTSQDIDNLLKNGFQKIQIAREGSGKTHTLYIITPLPN